MPVPRLRRRPSVRRIFHAALAWLVVAPLLFVAPAAARLQPVPVPEAGARAESSPRGAAVAAEASPRQATRLTIGPEAQCHATRCFVSVDVDTASSGRLVVRAGTTRRTLRVAAGESTRVVPLPRAALDGGVVATLDGTTTRGRPTVRAMTTNTAGRCARLAASDVWLSVGPPNPIDAVVNLPALGTLRVALIAVDFPGNRGTGDPMEQYLEWFEEGIATLERLSGGRFSMEVVATTPSWIRMPAPLDTYGLGDGATYDEHRVYIADALAAADPTVDFTGVDLPVVVVPDGTSMLGGMAFRGEPGVLPTDDELLGPAVTFGSDARFLGSGLIPHEIGHTLGLPDLYSFAGVHPHEFVGIWDLMGSIFEPWTDLFVWNRTRLGWLRPTQTLCADDGGSTMAVLQPASGDRGAVKSLFVRTGPHTAVVIENRQPVGLDTAICRAGALVLTLDSRVETGFGPVRVAGGRPGDSGCGIGARSNAPVAVGGSRSVDGVTVEVVGRRGRSIEVIVTVDDPPRGRGPR